MSVARELADLPSASPSTDANFDNGTFVVDISTNRVGVGTTVPASALDVQGTVQFGVDDTGYDVQFFGATTGKYMLWNQTTNALHFTDDAKLKLGDNQDFNLYHDGTNSYIENSTGTLKIADNVSGIAVSIGHTTSETTVNDNLTVTGLTQFVLATTHSGTTQFNEEVTVGVNDTGHDVKFFGATAGSFLLWDENEDSLELTDSTPLKIGDSADLVLEHDGTNSFIKNAVGILKIATETSGIAVTIGHTTSEVTVADNLTVAGNISVTGTGLFSTGKAIAMAMVFGG